MVLERDYSVIAMNGLSVFFRDFMNRFVQCSLKYGTVSIVD